MIERQRGDEEYERYLSIQLDPDSPTSAIVARLQPKREGATFTVSNSFEIIVSANDHVDVKKEFGWVEGDTIAEGYIFGKSDGKLSIEFPPHKRETSPKLKQAITALIESKIQPLMSKK